MPALPLGPEELERLDLRMARRDPNYRGKTFEAWVRKLWWRITRWGVEQKKAAKRKRVSEADRVRMRK